MRQGDILNVTITGLNNEGEGVVRVCDEGFKDIVILARGTNTPLTEKTECADPESVLLLQRNKWVIAHPEREPLIKQGAHPGVIGENKELFYK